MIQTSYTFVSKLGACFSRRTITLATLFLVTTLIAMTLGWVKLLANASGDVVFLIVLSTTTLLAVVVGYRRSTDLSNSCSSVFLCQVVHLFNEELTGRNDPINGLNFEVLKISSKGGRESSHS